MQLAPILHSYFNEVVRPRELETDMLPYIDSMLACLECILLLQSTRTGTVGPDELMKAIVKHLRLHLRSWGEDYVKPKHHYALHLPDMLDRFGYLLTSWVQERKHRLVSKYGRDRHNAKNFDSGIIEDVTCHQLWELQRPFYFAAAEAKPKALMKTVVEDLLPGIAPDAIIMLSEIAVNGGRACPDDVVAFCENGHLQLGRLLISLGIKSTTASSTSFVAKWKQLALEGMWLMCEMSDNDVVQIDTSRLDSVLLYRPAALSRCVVFVPAELRPQ